MNKEEFIVTLQACYFGDKGAFNKIVKEYEELHNKIDKAYEIVKDVSYRLNINFDDVLEILKGEVNE